MSTDDQQQQQQDPPEDDDQQQQDPPEDDGQQQQAPPEDLEDDDDDDQQDPPEGDAFPRVYVERLRARSAGYRARAKTAEQRTSELERALFTERVARLDVLADPSDLPYDAELLEDPDALAAAVQQLVRDRPHYRRRGTLDGAGTGSRERAGTNDGVSLAAIMRGQA